MNLLRRLAWTYLFLLIFEGVLRKWIVPQLSAPLLLIRDPVVFLIYFQAARCGLRFINRLFVFNLFLAVTTSITAILFGAAPGIANILVTVYGIGANYLQVPLIFLIPQILNRDDVLRMGKFLLWVVAPMTAILILQFKSSPDSIWNRGAMATHYDTVRPTGTFSFSNGVAYYFALTTVFVLYGYLYARTYKYWLLTTVTFCTLIAAACSGSRACIVSVAIVIVAALISSLIKGKGVLGLTLAAGAISVAVAVLSATTTVFDVGRKQMAQRFVDAGAHENGAEGFLQRYLGTFVSAFIIMGDVPFFGFGLGAGTNGAMAIAPNLADLLWPENEWQRLVFECGPVFGFLLCVFRTMLTWHIGMEVYRAFRRDNILPFLLFAASALLVLNGQWGGPTPLGFAIFGAGLTLAACRVPEEHEDEEHGEFEHDHEPEHEHVGDEHSPAHDPA